VSDSRFASLEIAIVIERNINKGLPHSSLCAQRGLLPVSFERF
jgi:hypothetical protein